MNRINIQPISWLPPTLPLVATTIIALVLSVLFGAYYTTTVMVAIIAVELGILLISLSQYELLAIGIIAISFLIDWYQLLGPPLSVATLIAFVLIIIRFPARSTARSLIPWPLLWMLLLILAVHGILQSVSLLEGLLYYIWVIFNPVLMYIVGAQVACDIFRVRRLLSMLSAFGTLIAVHTIIAAQTGIFLLATQRLDNYLVSKSDFILLGSQFNRVGSFLLNPDANSVFLAMIVFISIGLYMESSSRLVKIIYLGEATITLVALLFTFSTASLIAVVGGLIAFLMLSGRIGHSIRLIAFSCLVVMGSLFAFPLQLNLFYQHATAPSETLVRLGAWETGMRVISTYPLTGIGLGTISNYILRAEPYRVPAQYIPLTHPHNSYLELAAMAGLPVLMVFLTIVARVLWLALCNWKLAERQYRPLLGGAIVAVIVLSINSLAINGWTLAPLVVVVWLILGAISSSALTETLSSNTSENRRSLLRMQVKVMNLQVAAEEQI